MAFLLRRSVQAVNKKFVAPKVFARTMSNFHPIAMVILFFVFYSLLN